MKVIINSNESILQNTQGEITVIDKGYLDNSFDLAESIIGANSGVNWEIILGGEYALDDVGKLKYRQIQNSLTFFLGRASTIHARKLIRDSRLPEDLVFDTLVYKKGKDILQEYVFYKEELIKSIEEEIIKDKESSLSKITNLEQVLIEAHYDTNVNKILIYNVGEKIVVLYIKGKQLIGKADFMVDYFDMTLVEEEVSTQVRSGDYNSWQDSERIILTHEEFIESAFRGSKTKGGGLGEVHSFFKYNLKVEKI